MQEYLLATRLLKYRIQDSLDRIVTNGKLKYRPIRRELDTNFLLIMKKPNPRDPVFKDQAKLDKQTPIIGSLLTHDLGKQKLQKTIENQLKGAF